MNLKLELMWNPKDGTSTCPKEFSNSAEHEKENDLFIIGLNIYSRFERKTIRETEMKLLVFKKKVRRKESQCRGKWRKKKRTKELLILNFDTRNSSVQVGWMDKLCYRWCIFFNRRVNFSGFALFNVFPTFWVYLKLKNSLVSFLCALCHYGLLFLHFSSNYPKKKATLCYFFLPPPQVGWKIHKSYMLIKKESYAGY